jgi:hypothetical protein
MFPAARGGGKSSSIKKGKRFRGGSGSLPFSPSPIEEGSLGATPPAGGDNYNFNPAGGYYSNQVGGGYGFVNTPAALAEVPSFAGSYFPVGKVCTAGMPDNNSRGGNNFGQMGGSTCGSTPTMGGMQPTMPMSGGGQCGMPMKTGGMQTQMQMGGRRRRKRRTMKKWRQRGCNKKKCSTKRKRSSKHKRSTRRKMRGGNEIITR